MRKIASEFGHFFASRSMIRQLRELEKDVPAQLLADEQRTAAAAAQRQRSAGGTGTGTTPLVDPAFADDLGGGVPTEDTTGDRGGVSVNLGTPSAQGGSVVAGGGFVVGVQTVPEGNVLVRGPVVTPQDEGDDENESSQKTVFARLTQAFSGWDNGGKLFKAPGPGALTLPSPTPDPVYRNGDGSNWGLPRAPSLPQDSANEGEETAAKSAISSLTLWQILSLLFVALFVAASLFLAGIAAFVRYADPFGAESSFTPQLEAMQAVEVVDSTGSQLGFKEAANHNTIRLEDGTEKPKVAFSMDDVPSEYAKMVDALEGKSHTQIWGLVPHRIVMSTVCEVWSSWVSGERCPGASTPLMQVSRTVRSKSTSRYTRKLIEITDALVLDRLYPPNSPERARLYANTLFNGTAAGNPAYGLKEAAHTALGKEPTDLEFYELALMASFPKRPFALPCGAPQSENLMALQKQRARKLLTENYADDPRTQAALAQLEAMPNLSLPKAAAGDEFEGRCPRALNPILRFRSAFPTVFDLVEDELNRLDEAGIKPEAIRLTLNGEDQKAFREDVMKGLVESERRGGWKQLPSEGQAISLALATDSAGGIIGVFEKGYISRLDALVEMGSLAKKGWEGYAVAERGVLPGTRLCNRYNAGRRNAGGDTGYRNCDNPAAYIQAVEALGTSQNLPILDDLAKADLDLVKRYGADLGFSFPPHIPVEEAITFGRAQSTPRAYVTGMQALAKGIAGEDAIAAEPYITAAVKTSSGWTKPNRIMRDLRHWFATPEMAEARKAFGAAPFRRWESGRRGTMVSIAAQDPARAGEVGKTGTIGNASATRSKFASGAHASGGWFTMVIPLQGDLGSSSISITPFARATRKHSF